MRLNKILYIMLFVSTLMVLGCGGSDGDDSPTSPPPTGGNDDEPTIPDPSAATLVFPEDLTECNTGIVDPENESLSTVTFQWNASQNTDSYTVTVTNLNTGNSSFTNSTTDQADITIERGTPFSWFVTSRADGTTNTSESATFRFYNEGPGTENYAPFPAEAISPTRGQNLSGVSSINLIWDGADIDGDITEYEVFFGTDTSALVSLGTTTETSIADVAVTTSTTYFWQVITIDNADNSSTSEVFEFKIN